MLSSRLAMPAGDCAKILGSAASELFWAAWYATGCYREKCWRRIGITAQHCCNGCIWRRWQYRQQGVRRCATGDGVVCRIYRAPDRVGLLPIVRLASRSRPQESARARQRLLLALGSCWHACMYLYVESIDIAGTVWVLLLPLPPFSYLMPCR